MTENAYDLLKKTYEKQQAAIKAQEALQSQEKADREALAKKTLEANNRGVYTSYKNAINPYGANASQNNMPTGTSEYMRNAAYGTMLQGLGSNQLNYTTEMQNSNSLWQNWLAEKAGQEADIDAAYADAVIAQQNYDKEQERLSRSSGGGGGSSSGGSGVDISDSGNQELTGNDIEQRTKMYGNAVDNTPYSEEIVEINGKKYKRLYNKYGILVSSQRIEDSTTNTATSPSNRGSSVQ